MIEFIKWLAPFLPAWLPLVLASICAAVYLYLAIYRQFTINSRYENAMLAVAVGQGAFFYAQILGSELGMISAAAPAWLVPLSRWVISWIYMILILRGVWSWRRSNDGNSQ